MYAMFLTKKQNEIFHYLKDYIQENGFSPTFEEIANRFGFKSKGTVYKHINAIKIKGGLTQAKNRVRGIEINMEYGKRGLSVLGVVAAGRPIEAIEAPEEVLIPDGFFPGQRHFALKVLGDSMIDQHIADGDYVIVDNSKQPTDGETVVAIVDNQEATIKILHRTATQVELHPANKAMSPLVYAHDRISFNGVVVGVIRKY
ncbi:MAG: transcriptional repressor LexA [Candidatus Neomarinimicrobiota bacterium]